MRLGLRRRKTSADEARSFDDLLSFMSFGGLGYPFVQTSLQGDKESIEASFLGYVRGAYKSNGIIFACMLSRMLLFSEARFQFRNIQGGRPGRLFGNADLQILEKPWANATTGDLLTRAIQDADLAGNFYAVRERDRLRRLRPDWTTIILGSREPVDPETVDTANLDADLVGYTYQPGGPARGAPLEFYLPEQVVHFAPVPDPEATYRGMSWLTPVLREIMADNATTSHKLKFFENGATVNLAISLDASVTMEAFKEWVSHFKMEHEGIANAYKTLIMGGGATATPIGSNFKDISFKETQGAGEVRIASAAGVPPVIVGLSEGLQGASLNAGNFTAARRLFADGTMRPLWRNFSGSLATVIPVPSGAELWYDDRDIPFLKDDIQDKAKEMQEKATAAYQLFQGGWEPDSIIAALEAGDFSLLVGHHTGLTSVQAQPSSSSNGSGNPKAVPTVTG